MREWLYRPKLLATPKQANEVGTNFVPTFFLPVTLETVKFIRGALWFLDEDFFWEGTDEEKATARDIIRKQVAEPVKTALEICGEQQEVGANFREFQEFLQAMQGNGLPVPPWEFRLDIRGEPPNEEYWLQFRTDETP